MIENNTYRVVAKVLEIHQYGFDFSMTVELCECPGVSRIQHPLKHSDFPRVFTINNIRSRISGDPNYGTPINVPFNFDENLLVGKYIAIDVAVKTNKSDVEDGLSIQTVIDFEITSLPSFDLEKQIEDAFLNASKTYSPVSLKLPVLGFLAHKNGQYISTEEGKLQWEHKNKQFQLIAYGSKYKSLDLDFRKPANSFYHVNSPDCITLFWHDEGKEGVLTPFNIQHVFARFFAHVGGFGFNGEHRYGEAVRYYIDSYGKIVHQFKVDKVSHSAFGADESSRKETPILRLGDDLTEEMKDYLSEPVKGHYKPTVLFNSDSNVG